MTEQEETDRLVAWVAAAITVALACTGITFFAQNSQAYSSPPEPRQIIEKKLIPCGCITLRSPLSSRYPDPPETPTDIHGPKSKIPPRIYGQAKPGVWLGVDQGSWSPQPSSYSYQWERCPPGEPCEAIPGATYPEYQVQAEDTGKWLNVVVATDTGETAQAERMMLVEPSL